MTSALGAALSENAARTIAAVMTKIPEERRKAIPSFLERCQFLAVMT
jgi:hypothetical protein